MDNRQIFDTLEIGKKYEIHSYKHNGKIHQISAEAILIEKNDNYIVLADEKTKITEPDGRTWRTKEPAILFFFYNKWYNIIGQFKKNGIYYYCNMASPFIFEEGAIKYIDYDLDLRVFPDGSFKILDRSEYKYHKDIMKYPEEIDTILKEELSQLIDAVRGKEEQFSKEIIEKYHQKYIEIKA